MASFHVKLIYGGFIRWVDKRLHQILQGNVGCCLPMEKGIYRKYIVNSIELKLVERKILFDLLITSMPIIRIQGFSWIYWNFLQSIFHGCSTRNRGQRVNSDNLISNILIPLITAAHKKAFLHDSIFKRLLAGRENRKTTFNCPNYSHFRHHFVDNFPLSSALFLPLHTKAAINNLIVHFDAS